MKGDLHTNVKRAAANKHACYILITCGEAAADGKMSVQLSYEGDAALAAYLLQGAQSVLDQDAELQTCGAPPDLKLLEKRPKR